MKVELLVPNWACLRKCCYLRGRKKHKMHGVSININLPSFGGFTPEELTRKVECFALGLVEPKERNSTVPPCCYTEEEVERLLAERMQSIADGTAELVPHDEVKARIKALMA